MGDYDDLRRRGTDHRGDRDAAGGTAGELPPGKMTLAQLALGGPSNGVIQRKAERDANGVAPDAAPLVDAASSSSAQPLPGDVQGKFERSLGADLSSVRVHTGGESRDAAAAVGARAYTHGQDIHFAESQYDPASRGGEQLLAHEVAHTVQQQGGTPTRQNKLEVSTPGDSAEHEADHAADAMVAGQPASVTSSGGVARQIIQREPEPEANGGSQVQGGVPVTWTMPAIKFPEESLSYAKMQASYTAGVTATYQAKPAGEGHEGGTSVKAGVSAKGADPAALKVGVSKELETGITGLKASTGGSASYDGKTFTLGDSLSLETKWGPATLEYKPISFVLLKWEAGKEPEFAAASVSAGVKIPVHTFQASHGNVVQVDAQGELEVEVTPDYVRIGEWLSEHVLEVLGEDALISSGMIAAGVATIAISLWQITMGDEIRGRVDHIETQCHAYAEGYARAVRGEPSPTMEGAAAGYKDGQARLAQLQQQFNIPANTIAAGALKKYQDYFALYKQAWQSAWPTARAKILASYNADHSVDSWLADHGLPNERKTLELRLSEIDAEIR